MPETTAELDSKQEDQPSPNGKVENATTDWLELDDFAFIQQISAVEPVEELVEVPEWKMKVLCKALPATERFAIHGLAYDSQTRITDYKKAMFEILLACCFNPKTGHKAFRESHRNMLMHDPRHGVAVERLYLTIMRISRMFFSMQESTKKN